MDGVGRAHTKKDILKSFGGRPGLHGRRGPMFPPLKREEDTSPARQGLFGGDAQTAMIWLATNV